ncbi:MAG: phage tail sheath family protein [Alphaproteobacteria bacterium]|nr:phage tail sheath family protein [Alphaproteobacteria bacterium]
MLTLPDSFNAGRGKASGMFVPAIADEPQLAWNRALAFRPLVEVAAAADIADTAASASAPASADGKKDDKSKSSSASKTAAKAPDASSENRLRTLVDAALPGKWDIQAPNGDDAITLTNAAGDAIRFPVSRTLMNVKEGDNGAREWDLAWGADEVRVLQLISGFALAQGIKHSGDLPVADARKSASIDADTIHDALAGNAPVIHSLEGYHAWRAEFAEALFKEIAYQTSKGVNESKAQAMWDTLSGDAKQAWDYWLRSHPGIRRLELALSGFFENGGTSAYIACAVQTHGAGGPNKRAFLERSFDSVAAVAMLCAPGLELSWQQAILDYAGPKGRGDLFAIMEAPRYLLTRAPRGTEVDDFRWTRGDSPYEIAQLQVASAPDATELRFGGYSSDTVLDRSVPRDDGGYGAAYGPWLMVDNPLSSGAHDRYVICPPAGHVAGVIAMTDLKGGGGVHKAPANELVSGVAELVTSVSDREQGTLNMKGINIIRHRPAAGIRIWGARTTASDPLWTYVNVRRLFLFVERSVRDAINWAVFLPNNDVTRRDLADTIGSFLFQLYNRGMLDGVNWKDSFQVQCDRENNPDVDVRSGILTVDVQFRPVFPAEFIRIRFRQTPMAAPS